MDPELENQFIKSLEAEYTCSISKMPMTDPVIAADGHTYERNDITEWLKHDDKSPNTGLPLEHTNLITNVVLKNIIHKVNTELYGFLAKEEGLKTYITQLKEEIDYLKVELQHEKERTDEQIEKEEREFKSRRIEKGRHQDKDNQLKIIREQKNLFQKELLELRTSEQQKNREIRMLKDELSKLKEDYNKSCKDKRKFEEKSTKYFENRAECMSKVRHSFVSNLVFIGHLLKGIEDAKKIIDLEVDQEEKREKGTEESINVDADEERRNLRKQIRGEVIKEIEEGITERICGLRREIEEEEEDENEMDPEIRRLIIRRRIMQRRGEGYLPPPSVSVNADTLMRRALNRRRIHDIRRGPQELVEPHRERAQLQLSYLPQNELPIIQEAQPEAQPQTEIQNQNPQEIPLEQQTESQNQPENQPRPQIHTQRIEEGSEPSLYILEKKQGMVKQLDSIKWLMSKRNYRRLPSFYDYQFVRDHRDEDVYWFGVRIRVLESKIPFVEYLPHCWNHVRILDLGSCNIDDIIWQRFIESRQNFTELTYIDLHRNQIKNITENEITDFMALRNFIITANNLESTSRDILRDLKARRADIQIDYDEEVFQEEVVDFL